MEKKKITIFAAIAIALAAVLIVAYDAYRFFDDKSYPIDEDENPQREDTALRESKSCVLIEREREFGETLYYTGPLADSHVHMPVASKIVSVVANQLGFEDMPAESDIPTHDIECLLKNEGVTKAFGFYIMPNTALSLSVRSAKKAEENGAGIIIPFFMPPPIDSLHPHAEDVEEIILSNNGLFKGIGELALYHYPSGIEADQPYFLELYRIADEQGLIAMMHPRPKQEQMVEEIVGAHPDVVFLFHAEESILPLIDKYPNTYFSVDTFLYIYGFEENQFQKLTKEEWLVHMRSNFEKSLNSAVEKWKPIIEENPDRFLWSTDRWYTWHFDPEVGGLIEEFSRSLIGQLNVSVQEKFAYRNAEGLLQR